MKEGKIVIQDGKPSVLLSESAKAAGGVCIQSGIELAQQLARKIIEQQTTKSLLGTTGL